MQGWNGFGRRGEAASDSRVTGLLTQLDGSSETDAPPGPINVSASETTLETSDLPSSDLPSQDEPPVDLASLPGAELPAVEGPGVGVPNFSPPSSAPSTSGGGGTSNGPAPASGLARGETSFLGIRDSGETFVYVIDVSGSMSDEGAINVAKAELMSSLASLHGGQQFQVIFYNEKPIPLRLPGRAPQQLYDATDLNKTLARQVIAAVQADLGTKHMPALKLALEIQPDVLFFLTDADEPALTAKDLDEIRRANAGGTRVHAVEFGKGGKLNASPSLERLAQQNHGAYQYRDVMRFRR
jgi:Ca-activated chloride channel family protein